MFCCLTATVGNNILPAFRLRHPTFIAKTIMPLAFYFFENVSLKAASYMMRGLDFFQSTVSRQPEKPGSAVEDVRLLAAEANLLPDFRKFITCPKCWGLHEPLSESSPARTCGWDLAGVGGPVCDALITHEMSNRLVEVQGLRDWIGRLLARPDIEELLLNGSKRTRRKHIITSVLEADFARHLTDDQGESFLLSLDSPELRLLFSLNVDGFNPMGNTTAGTKYSATGIYMALLTLPPDIRYKRENMYLCSIIPGPVAPHGDEINHLLSPLVDEFLVLWKGVHITPTSKAEGGRFVKAVCACLASDIPAATQVAGQGHHSTTEFVCPHCHIDKGDLEYSCPERPLRDPQSRRELLDLWDQCVTEDDQDAFFKKHGIRRSELDRLPYWDPLLMKVIEAMHLFFLNLLKRHLLMFGFDASKPEIVASDPTPTHELTPEVEHAKECVRAMAVKELGDIRKETIVALCKHEHLRYAGSKMTLLRALWVSCLPICLRLSYSNHEISAISMARIRGIGFIAMMKNGNWTIGEYSNSLAPYLLANFSGSKNNQYGLFRIYVRG